MILQESSTWWRIAGHLPAYEIYTAHLITRQSNERPVFVLQGPLWKCFLSGMWELACGVKPGNAVMFL